MFKMSLKFVSTAIAKLTCDPGSGGSPDGEGIDLGSCLRLNDDTPIADVYSNPAFLINLIVRNLFVLAGIILFFLIIFAGFKFVTGGKKGVESAKTMMTTAIVGFIIMFTAYWVVQIVKIVTGVEIPL